MARDSRDSTFGSQAAWPPRSRRGRAKPADRLSADRRRDDRLRDERDADGIMPLRRVRRECRPRRREERTGRDGLAKSVCSNDGMVASEGCWKIVRQDNDPPGGRTSCRDTLGVRLMRF